MIDPTTSSQLNHLLEDVLDQFEVAWTSEESYLSGFVECCDMRLSLESIAELVRADIDRRYSAACNVNLHRYFESFPELLRDANSAQSIGFEDYRSRKTRGLSLPKDRWRWIPGVYDQPWFRDLYLDEHCKPLAEPHGSELKTRVGDASPRDEEPRPGEKFGDFQLIATLGRGTFSQVFLATQPSLASRYVAIKVVKTTLDEPEHLARLQHTGIVPIYSLHRMNDYSVLCMPYFGAATLADWLGDGESNVQRNGQSLIGTVQQAQTRIGSTSVSEEHSATEVMPNEVERIRVWNASGAQPLARLMNMDEKGCFLWLARRIASALAHAHERDVIHGDLKPANVLLKNDGEPALIDFNLARKLEDKPSTHVGGTLPYMSPEQLQMLLGRRLHLSAASDIYSLGIILYQIAENKMPFPMPLSIAESDVSIAIQHRKNAIHFSNPALSAGLKSIIVKCLAISPSDRYSSGMPLLEDLDCEASNLPLMHTKESILFSRFPKLARRYPRLFSVVPVLAIAALLVTVVSVTGWYWWRQANQWSARNSLSLWTSLMSEHVPNLLEGTDDEIRSTFATMDNAITTMMGAGKKSGPADRLQWLPGQELEAAEREFFEDVLVLSGLASERRSQLRADQIPLIEQWQALCNHAIAGHGLAGALTQQPLNNMTKDLHFSVLEERPDLRGNTQTTEGERILHARFLAQQGMPVRSIEALSGITPRRSIKTLYWITVGDAQRKLGHSEAAVLAYGLAINEAPRSAIGYSRRSQLLSEMKKWEDAERDCTSLINLNPKSSYRLAERARLRESMGKIDKAIADMDEAIAIEPRFNRYYFFRSRLGRQRNDSQKAQEDYRLGLSMTPSTTEDWISRALAHLPKYPEKSMADLKRAEQMAPNRFEVLQNQAHILSEYLHDEEAAIMALSLILDNDPDNVWARVDRCVLLARNGKKQEVLSEVDRIIGSGKAILPDTYYQIACAHSLLAVQYPEFQERSLHYLSKAIIAGYGHDLLGTDKDLDPIRSSPHFSALMDVTNLSKKATVNN